MLSRKFSRIAKLAVIKQAKLKLMLKSRFFKLRLNLKLKLLMRKFTRIA